MSERTLIWYLPIITLINIGARHFVSQVRLEGVRP